MGAMKNLLIAIEEECGRCKDVKDCENCKMRLDVGDKIVYVAGKTRKILGVDLKSELAKTGAFILSCMRVCLVLLLLTGSAKAAEIVNVGKLADAIYKAENSVKFPYGIKSIDTKGDVVYARKICINTIKNNIKRYNKTDKKIDYITFLGNRYCPPTAHSLNKHWVKNVKSFYYR